MLTQQLADYAVKEQTSKLPANVLEAISKISSNRGRTQIEPGSQEGRVGENVSALISGYTPFGF